VSEKVLAPTIVLVVQQGFGARVLLQTEVLPTLIKAGARVVVLSSDKSTTKRYLCARGIDIEVEEIASAEYQLQASAPIARALQLCRSYGLRSQTVDDHFKMQWKDALRLQSVRGMMFLGIVWVITRLMRRSRFVMKVVVGLENTLDCPRVHDSFFRKYRPDVLVVTSLGTFDEDRYLMREAKRNDCRVISYVLSWDNTTVRGLGIGLSDKVIVWSNVMKDELIRLHKISAEKITVCGVPHYDYYINEAVKIPTKEKLLKLFNLIPGQRLLLLATKSPNTFLYNPDIALEICHAIKDGRLPRDCHLIARLHPIYFRRSGAANKAPPFLDEWESVERQYGQDCLTIDYPSMIPGGLKMFMQDSEIPKLASLLKHSEVVINMFSTLNIEASIFDTPAINVAFDFEHKSPPGDKIARFNIHYDEVQTHNQRIVKSGGVSMARSTEDMIQQISNYLDNPNSEADGRRRIVESECGVNLGKAGKALAGEILQTIN